MKKVLFFGEKEKRDLINAINNELKIKNRLLGLIISNPDRKTTAIDSSIKRFKYEQQIMLLQEILYQCSKVKTRNDIKELNRLIDEYNAI